MYYIVKNKQIIASSQDYIAGDGETIQEDFTEEQIALIDQQYYFVDGEFVKGERAIAFEIEEKANRKQAIIMELGSLKQEKDGLTLLGEDTKEVDAKILALKNEYKSIS